MISKCLKMDTSVENKHIISDCMCFIQDLRLRYGLQQSKHFLFVTNPYFHVSLRNRRSSFPCELKYQQVVDRRHKSPENVAIGKLHRARESSDCRDYERSLAILACPAIKWTSIIILNSLGVHSIHRVWRHYVKVILTVCWHNARSEIFYSALKFIKF